MMMLRFGELCMQNFERRAIATARHMRQKTGQMMTAVGLPLDKLSGMVQPVRDLVANSVTGSANVSTLAVAEFLAVSVTVLFRTMAKSEF